MIDGLKFNGLGARANNREWAYRALFIYVRMSTNSSAKDPEPLES
jgi:hypothetical protein